MTNRYYLEKTIAERERETAEILAHSARISQLHGVPRVTGGGSRLPVRVRFGLFLIRLGGHLAV